MIGQATPAILIFKGKYVLEDLCELIGSSKIILAVSENGWSNDELAMVWIKYFDKHNPTTGTYRLFLLDNHGSHCTIQFVDYCHDHKIVLYFLPPHTTHKLQPLDVGIFSLFVIFYDQLVKVESKYNGIGVIKREYMRWILLARQKINTRSNILIAFLACGLAPFNPDRVLKIFKKVVLYTNRPITPPDQITLAERPPIITPVLQIRHGSVIIQLPIGKFEEAKQFVDKFGTVTPSLTKYRI